jgi:polyphosphate kinase 2 (PPK2 family)
MSISTSGFRVEPGKPAGLAARATDVDHVGGSGTTCRHILARHVKKLSSLQRLHYASGHYALLVIFQGMDGAGTDGAIRHVMSGVNPQGCEVFGFTQPSSEELGHDFLCLRPTLPLCCARYARAVKSSESAKPSRVTSSPRSDRWTHN